MKGMKEALQFDDDTCLKNLKSLMLKGYKLIECKNGATGQLKDEDIFVINEAFTSQVKRIVFPVPVLEEVYKKGKDDSHINDML